MRQPLEIPSVVALALVLALAACRQQRREPAVSRESVQVLLNHLYVTVDSATYGDIERSAFLRDTLAGFEQRTTLREGGRSYRASYLYGRHTYFELFQPDAQRPLGLSGLALGVDRAGEIEDVRRRLLAVADGDSSRVPRTTNTRAQRDRAEAGVVPWYISTTLAPPGWAGGRPRGMLFTWVMEFHPEFLEGWFPDSTAPRSAPGYPISRLAVRAIEYRPDRLLGDLVGATFALDSTERTVLLGQLAALGYDVTSARDGRASASGPGVVIHLEPADAVRHGLVTLELELVRPAARAEYRFGSRSSLATDGRRARWTF